MLGGVAAAILAWRKQATAGLTVLACGAHRRELDVRAQGDAELRGLQARARPRRGPCKSARRPTDLIVTYNVALPSLVYYLRRHIDVFYNEEEALRVLRSNAPLYLLSSEDDYKRILAPALPAGALCRVTSRPTFDVKLRNVLARERLPEIVLMTNKCGGR